MTNSKSTLELNITLDTRSSEIIHANGQHFRLSPWRASKNSALITPLTAFEILSKEAVKVGVAKAKDLGYQNIYTSALADNEIAGFLQSGFVLKEQLYVLTHNLTTLRPKFWLPGLKIRKPSPTDLVQVAQVDERCFDPFWVMNREGLLEAEAATTKSRFRVATMKRQGKDEIIVGYAITGLGNRRGYLQRLAVDPEFQGRHLGLLLVEDGFTWLRFWRAQEVWVNTQTKNERALNFYLMMGFSLRDERLNILEFDLHA